MDTFECMFTRRSIRKFIDKDISAADITHILQAAMAAPSAGNAQAWDFIVVRQQHMREAITTCTPYAGMAPLAPVCIVVCADTSREKYKDYWVQDCSAAMQNILLAARAKGIGSVWLGIHPMEERVRATQQVFFMPDHVMPLGIAVLGYPEQAFSLQDRFDPAKVHSEIW